MLLKKPPYSISTLLLIIFLTLQSCEKKTRTIPEKKQNLAEINRLIDLGHKHYKNEKFDSSYYYFNKAKYAADIKKDTSRIIHSLGWMALIQKNTGDFSGSEATATEALPFMENTTKYPNGAWTIYNVLGNDYLYTSDYDNALFFFNKAMALKTDQLFKFAAQNNIALVYMEKKDYHHAIQILLPLTVKKELVDDPETFSIILDNLGYSFHKVGDPKAFDYLNQAMKIREQRKDLGGMISSYYHISEYYKLKNLDISVNYALLAYRKATKLNRADDRLQCLGLLIERVSGNQLKKFSLDYLHINDSLNKVRQKAKNQFAKIKYDSKKEKEENRILKIQKTLQSEQQKNRNLFFYFIVAMGIVTTSFISYFLVAKNRREKTEASYSTEIRIAKKLHDELANDVYQTMAFAETQDLSSSQNKEILLTNLDTIYSRTRNISKENSAIDTGLNFVAGLKEMISDFNTDAVTILINGKSSFNWNALESNKKIIVYRVLQELLVNMKKHSQCSLVMITFKKIENKLQIEYSDNGIGAAFDKINSRNGLQNVENRLLSIKGTITFNTKPSKGFKTSLTIPI
jgi:tetratricopeptide (TPR) repeat protein